MLCEVRQTHRSFHHACRPSHRWCNWPANTVSHTPKVTRPQIMQAVKFTGCIFQLCIAQINARIPQPCCTWWSTVLALNNAGQTCWQMWALLHYHEVPACTRNHFHLQSHTHTHTHKHTAAWCSNKDVIRALHSTISASDCYITHKQISVGLQPRTQFPAYGQQLQMSPYCNINISLQNVAQKSLIYF